MNAARLVVDPSSDICDLDRCPNPLTGPQQGYMIKTGRWETYNGQQAQVVRMACSPTCAVAILREEGLMA